MNNPAPRVHLRSTLLRLLTMLFLFGAVTVPDASALVTRDAVELDERVLHPAPFRQSPRLIIPGEGGPAAEVAAAFRSRRGGNWTIRFDELTGRPALISGSGVPLLPGRGNTLTPSLLGLPSTSFDLADAEPLARAFITAEGDLLLPDVGELRLSYARSGSFDGGRIHYFDYDWYVGGILVEGARVFLRVNHGNIVQFGTDGVGQGRIPAVAILDADDALARTYSHAGGMNADDFVVEPGRLLILPLAADSSATPWGGGARYRDQSPVADRRE